ncbi:MAG: hypothetical protein HQM14_11370 [SAR324 cluster bacterium]|nr:hypothetical protein [SAR324 cluster bacterium]
MSDTNEMSMDQILTTLQEANIYDVPASAFKAIKNKYFDLQIPYSHLIIFANSECENVVFHLRKALSLPYFHAMGPNGKSVFINRNDQKRLVVDFLFEYQTEARIEHYGKMLEAYIMFLDIVCSTK